MFWRVTKNRSMIESVLSHTQKHNASISSDWPKFHLKNSTTKQEEICNMQFYCVNWSTQCFSRLAFEVQTQSIHTSPVQTDSKIEMFAFYIKKLMLDFRNQTLPRYIKWHIFSIQHYLHFPSVIENTIQVFLWHLKYFVFFIINIYFSLSF